MSPTRKKHETHANFSQKAWFCTSLERLCNSDGDAPLIKVVSGHDVMVRTRAKVLEMVKHLAATLTDFGVTRKDVVLFDTPLCAEALILWTACLWLGASGEFLSVDMRVRDKHAAFELARSQQESAVVVVVKTPEQAKKYHELAPESPVIYIDDKGEAPADKVLGWPLPPQMMRFELAAEAKHDASLPGQAIVGDDLSAAFVYSQGSHETARRISISHAHLRDQAENLAAEWALGSTDCLFIHLPTIHTISLVLFATAMHSGAAIAFCDSGSPGHPPFV